MGLPLEAIRVIDLGQIFAAPYCTLQLAQMGAEIIKIEPPGVGESLRRAESSPGGVGYSFLMLNANKRSATRTCAAASRAWYTRAPRATRATVRGRAWARWTPRCRRARAS